MPTLEDPPVSPNGDSDNDEEWMEYFHDHQGKNCGLTALVNEAKCHYYATPSYRQYEMLCPKTEHFWLANVLEAPEFAELQPGEVAKGSFFVDRSRGSYVWKYIAFEANRARNAHYQANPKFAWELPEYQKNWIPGTGRENDNCSRKHCIVPGHPSHDACAWFDKWCIRARILAQCEWEGRPVEKAMDYQEFYEGQMRRIAEVLHTLQQKPPTEKQCAARQCYYLADDHHGRCVKARKPCGINERSKEAKLRYYGANWQEQQ